MVGALFNAAIGKTKWKEKILNRANCIFKFEKAAYDDPSAYYYCPENGEDGEQKEPKHAKPIPVWCSIVAKRDIFWGEGLHIDYAVDPMEGEGSPVTNDESSTARSESQAEPQIDPSQSQEK
jgi:hypothetical protein